MAYVRKRSTTRRNRRRGSRTLSTRNIFNNKSSRSQAKQISALKKRITAVSRKCRPEVKVVESSTQNYGFATTDVSGVNQWQIYALPTPKQPQFGQEIDNTKRIGDLVTMYPSNIFLTMQYEEVYNSLLSGFSTTRIPLPTSSIQARVVFIQDRIAGQATPTIADVFDQDGYSTGTLIDAQMMMKMPFATGITTKYKILSDRVYNISQDKGQVSIRKSIRPAIRSLRWYNDDSGTTGNITPRGQIYMLILTSGWSSLTYDSGEVNTTDYNKLNFTFRTRTPFTDA